MKYVVKTEAMLFGTHATALWSKQVYKFKHLGVLFDEHVSWNSHVKYMLSWACKRPGMLRHLLGNQLSHCPNTIYMWLNVIKLS